MTIKEKTYTIGGSEFIQRPLGPFQLIRLLAVLDDIGDEIKNKFTSVIENDKVEIDLTMILNTLEASGDDGLISKITAVVLIDPVSNKPVYLAPQEVKAALASIDAQTLLEVVADFFTLNDVLQIASSLSKISSQARTLFTRSADSGPSKKT